MTDTLFKTFCKGCGAELPSGPYAEVRQWCGAKCYNDHYHALEKAARLDAKRDRPPCKQCGGPVAIEKDRRAVYCSMQCQRKGGRAEWRLRLARICEHCRKPYVPNTKDQRFCGQWCRAQVDFRKHQPRPCEWCGTMIANPRRAAAKYCCSTCAARAREAARRAKNET